MKRENAIFTSEADQRAAAVRERILSMTDEARDRFIDMAYAAGEDGTLLSQMVLVSLEFLVIAEGDEE